MKHTKEGTESSAFWFALGGKQSYTSKKVASDVFRDPHLFTFSFNKGCFFCPFIYLLIPQYFFKISNCFFDDSSCHMLIFREI